MLLEELLRCQIHEWYPAFRGYSIRTVIIPLPAAFLRYLVGQPAYPDLDADADADADTDTDEEPLPFLLPAIISGRQPFALIHAHHPDPVSLLNSDFFFGSSNEDVFDPDADHPLRPEFPELEAAIDAAIAELGSAALPKLNWSAPKDATFMSADGTTRCTCFAEVAMLLRSSDCVAHDLASARQSCEDFVRPEGARRNAQKVSASAEEGDETRGSEGTIEALSKIREEGGKTNDEDCDVEAATEERMFFFLTKEERMLKLQQRNVTRILGWMMGSNTTLPSASGTQAYALSQSSDVSFGRGNWLLCPREIHQLTTHHWLDGVPRCNRKLRLSLMK
ncbi:hypothetical protein BDA96_03G010300 [Sorghum bicolor]|uniref:Uncharacterized protein n=2 Tax=Sorghum bicolor TaxID=4558 RepID=C5XK84_SORBI|nr:hypothetical protein SORBI_3003G009400 [Sorghum bicolor]KAG0535814.1 hypothetical protein BDA96_03G010300 [Sorghum bicolor]KAG0535815.1 hypothetical protein BDA96_03G010300 [Sorghum bicolor]KAG0535816.1 hypothetical protein BDA96_03G010300 [Sorghum bicolor]OQU86075.1 hypothetical protein SORBI_3003G009400 [Sorghum bicolor]